MQPLVVIDVVGLTPRLLDSGAMPRLAAFAKEGSRAHVEHQLPAVTCSIQSTYLTGLPPSGHGVVGNGWYFRDLAEVWLWRQSNHLVSGPKVWETAREQAPGLTCAKLFWWYNMYSSADISATPRPYYPADGRKIPGIYTEPPELEHELNAELGTFPLFNFWGPTADIRSSRWIARAARAVQDRSQPTLTLVYLPHLDYPLQRLGPDAPEIATEATAIDEVAGDLIAHARDRGAQVMVLSEYGISAVRDAVHINRALREAGLVRVRHGPNGEVLDPGASRAFAVSDHQIAHVYVRNEMDRAMVAELLEKLDGVARVLDGTGKREAGLDHPRSGELVAVSEPDRWFSYYYWLDDSRAPDFARTVDIHHKPGYDPVELFLDPALRLPKASVAWRLAKKALGQRTLMDVIPLDASLVRGSHGAAPTDPAAGPLVLSSQRDLLAADSYPATAVHDLMLEALLGKVASKLR